MTKHRLATLALVAVGVAALSGCGSKSTPSTGTPGATDAPAATSAGGGNGY